MQWSADAEEASSTQEASEEEARQEEGDELLMAEKKKAAAKAKFEDANHARVAMRAAKAAGPKEAAKVGRQAAEQFPNIWGDKPIGKE
jgi:predicted NAD-dependent protein-ADP-ribosyltransferase YbiA (DUF1768 family)